MIIKDIFAKPIDRDIKGVIKVGQDDDINIRQELEEYVVTRELEKHFRDFFTSYKRGIQGNTDNMGVWISGFFGSGKSHFLKILSYLLANIEVDGKHAIDYFVDDQKIRDTTVLADMRLAGTIPTDVILFNIDSKSEMSGKQSKDAIVSVFLRVFNEMLGFCGAIPHLADLERKLSDEGKYEAFKANFEEATGSIWTEARNDFDFIQDDVVDVLSDMDFMSVEAARNWCEKATGRYDISIEDFARLVKRYIDRKGNNHHVVFLVDEIGQYIGDDTKLMLNLQTVTEDLGRICNGKAWVIVTSQQDIDSITRTKGNDFSKIQGRFDTRLSLSSANVDEVIRKRILEKTPVGRQTLTLLYDDKITFIKNLILFNDGVEKKLYANREDFAAVYPFIPYQFNLLGDVLTSIRTHGASGKHLSEGERSMLAMFKESAMRIMNDEPGRIVPFYMFYDALEKFLDHSHSGVITKALDNEKLNPEHAESCFDVNVLKTLFMIKYVKEIKANLEQVTSLMVTSVDDDRLTLRGEVEAALNRLTSQTLVQKNGEIYVFLTYEEQEINREIERQGQTIEQSEIIAKVSEMIFDGLYDEKKYRYPAFNGRYQFAFNQVVDNRPYKSNQSFDLTLKVLTPYSDEVGDEQRLRLNSGQSSSVLIVLPDDRSFLEEIRTALSIEKFLRHDAVNAITKYEQIKEAKKVEMRDRNAAARLFLEEALKDADIYVNGDKLQGTSRDIKSRINEAMGKLVARIYHKLSYIDAAVSDNDIRNLLHSGSQQISRDGVNTAINELALGDVASYIGTNTDRHTKTSMKSMLDRFMKAPYGFIEVDVQWLVTRLFKSGDIAFYVNSEPVTLVSRTEDEIHRFVTRKEFNERLMMDRREKATDKQKKAVRDVIKELFKATVSSDDDDALMKSFLTHAGSFRNQIEKLEIYYQNQPAYPGRAVIMKGKALITSVQGMKFSSEFFQTVDRARDDYFDLAEDYEPVKAFFEGEQRGIFDKSLLYMHIYDDSKVFIVDKELESIVKETNDILHMSSPYKEIYRLPHLNEKFMNRYSAILNDMLGPVNNSVDAAHKRVSDEIDKQDCRQEFGQRCNDQFVELTKKAEACNNVASLQNIRLEADALKVRFLNDISDLAAKRQKEAEEERLRREQEKKEHEKDHDPDNGDKPVSPVGPEQDKPVKKYKTISIKDVNVSTTWQLETEEDIQRCVDVLKAKLSERLEENTIINLEF